jgi:branched-chain amino acid transport system ATP-binding protein
MSGAGPSESSPSTIVLSARGLRKSFSGFEAVGGVDLDVREGSIHALIGPNGAGKTTMFNLLTKTLAPSAGTIHYRGRDITAASSAAIAQAGLVRSFQISAVFPHLSALENVRLPLQRKHGMAHQWWRPARTLAALDARAHALLESVGLGSLAHLPAQALSYGRKRALELATTLALDPDVLLLDEPLAGMGREDIDGIATLILDVAKGRTVLMVEHNLGVVDRLCDRVTVLARGKVLADGTYAEVSAHPEVREAYMGVAA